MNSTENRNLNIIVPDYILQLSVEERIRLVEAIWDSIAATPEEVDITEAQKEELDRRMEAYRQNPGRGVSWQQVQEDIDNLP